MRLRVRRRDFPRRGNVDGDDRTVGGSVVGCDGATGRRVPGRPGTPRLQRPDHQRPASVAEPRRSDSRARVPAVPVLLRLARVLRVCRRAGRAGRARRRGRLRRRRRRYQRTGDAARGGRPRRDPAAVRQEQRARGRRSGVGRTAAAASGVQARQRGQKETGRISARPRRFRHVVNFLCPSLPPPPSHRFIARRGFYFPLKLLQ